MIVKVNVDLGRDHVQVVQVQTLPNVAGLARSATTTVRPTHLRSSPAPSVASQTDPSPRLASQRYNYATSHYHKITQPLTIHKITQPLNILQPTDEC